MGRGRKNTNSSGSGSGGRNGSRPATRWGSDENLMRVSEGERNGKEENIRMEELSERKEMGLKTREIDLEAPEPPQKAHLQDIIVNTTWEVVVEGDKR